MQNCYKVWQYPCFINLKLLQNTPGVKTFLKSRTETSPTEIQCVETLLPFKIPIWRLFHWDMLAIWLLCCMANLERIINILKNMPSCFFMSLRLRIRVLGKIQTRIFESKHRFFEKKKKQKKQKKQKKKKQ